LSAPAKEHSFSPRTIRRLKANGGILSVDTFCPPFLRSEAREPLRLQGLRVLPLTNYGSYSPLLLPMPVVRPLAWRVFPDCVDVPRLYVQLGSQRASILREVYGFL